MGGAQKQSLMLADAGRLVVAWLAQGTHWVMPGPVA